MGSRIGYQLPSISPCPLTQEVGIPNKMIIGSGLIANALRQQGIAHSGVIYLAAGVSNSGETCPAAFEREFKLVRECLGMGMRLVYFSSCSILDPTKADSPYVLHKKAVETLIRQRGYAVILRLAQVVGPTKNPYVLTNYLFNRIDRGEPFQVWTHARRNLIDVEDVVRIADKIISDSTFDCITSNIASDAPVTSLELVKIFEAVLGKKAQHTLVDAGGFYDIEIQSCLSAARSLSIDLESNYATRCIQKYYGR